MEYLDSDNWEDKMTKFQHLANEAEDLDQFFLNTKALLEKKSRLFWQIKFFEKYEDYKINPWGLRIQIFPNIREPSSELKTRWERILQGCSSHMMLLLREHHQAELVEINKELLELSAKGEKLKHHASFSNRDAALSSLMESYNKDLITRKSKKFDKDKRAFALGNTYKWGSRNISNRNRSSFPSRGNPMETDISSSCTETDSSSVNIPTGRGRASMAVGMETRQAQKRGGHN